MKWTPVPMPSARKDSMNLRGFADVKASAPRCVWPTEPLASSPGPPLSRSTPPFFLSPQHLDRLSIEHAAHNRYLGGTAQRLTTKS
jgi:hypothetical protein